MASLAREMNKSVPCSCAAGESRSLGYAPKKHRGGEGEQSFLRPFILEAERVEAVS